MKKTILTIMGFVAVVLCLTTLSQALDRSFTVSANIPQATGVAITASSVNPSNNHFTVISGNTLSFNPITFNTANGIFLPDHFFAIDVGSVGGAGIPDVTVTYTEGANPNSPSHGLGWKSTATFMKVTGATGSQTETAMTSHGPKKMLKAISGESIGHAEISGGFLRVYVGIVTKDNTAVIPDPVDSEPFIVSDKPGLYDGTLLVSATIP